MNKILLLIFFCLINTVLKAQFWYDDGDGSGFSLFQNGSKKSLVSGRLNTKDNSVTASVFRRFTEKFNLIPPTSDPDKPDPEIQAARPIKVFGIGLTAKGKTESGLATFLSSGKISPASTFGGYGLHQRYVKNKSTRIETYVIGVRYNQSSYRLFDPALSYELQAGDTQSFGGWEYFAGAYHLTPPKKGSSANFLYGISLNWSEKNNFSTLDKVELKTVTNFVSSPPGSATHVVTQVDDDGNTYATISPEKPYFPFNDFRVQLHLGYIFEGGRTAVRLYPSIDWTNQWAPQYNAGLGVYFLKLGQPTLTNGGIFFEFNDITNAKISTKTFFQHSFKIGVIGELNFISGDSR